jgi:hypothetical protein
LKNTRKGEGKVEEEELDEREGRGSCLIRDTIFIKGGNNIYGLKKQHAVPLRPSGKDRVMDM